MSSVARSAPRARVRERLARTRSGPDVGVVRYSSEPKSVGPDADAGEEVPLAGPGNVSCAELCDAAPIDSAGRDVSSGEEPLKPVGRERIDLVVRRAIHATSSPSDS